MVPESAVAVLFVGFVGTGLLAYFVLYMAKSLKLLALPNERSSHSQATPAVGGVAICIPILIYLGSVAVHFPALWGLFGALALMAVVGLVDDLRELSRTVRLVCQVLASALVLTALYNQGSALLWPVMLLVLVWHINLFNFMDGIDGIAASQALFFAVAALVLTPDMVPWMGYLLCVLAGSQVAFLVYNWAPAAMFMGDVGSTFLGLLLAVVGLLLWQSGQLSAVATLILLATFWFDASYTLAVRLFSDQPFTQPHRSHLYQRLADRWGHGRTVGLFWLFALVWLLPLAYFAQQRGAFSWLSLILALLPLALMARRMRAGVRDEPHADAGSEGL